jgi:hypothetical protein
MRRLARLAWLMPLAALAGEPAAAPMPAALGVQIEKPAGDGVRFSRGSGVYLGAGRVLTAAHVVAVDPASKAVMVILDGWKVEAGVAAIGLPAADLALVQIPLAALSRQRQAQAGAPMCDGDPAPDQPMVVAAEGMVTPARTVGTAITSEGKSGEGTNLLSTGFHQGSSGGGVFDPVRGCLWGILQMEMSGKTLDLTAFAPARKIKAFLGQP